MDKQRVAESPRAKWTRADDYVVAMARKRSARRLREAKKRTEPEMPRLLLSTVPFLGLIILVAILGFAIMVAAFPGAQPQVKPRQAAERELGIAPKGWFQEAQQEMHH